jgi:DNA-binding NarL/FixJ family response regulator
MITVLVADDHPVVRHGLEGMLATQSDFKVVGSAGDGPTAAALILECSPDVALIDLRMPGLGGVEVIERVRKNGSETRLLVLTTYENDADILSCLGAGAAGYILKDTPREELFSAIRRAARGERVLSPRVAERMRKRDGGDPLSPRELEVLIGVARGEVNRAIAKRLFISEATVKTHLLHIFSKLGVSQRTAAVTEALRRGLIDLSDQEPRD